MSHETDSRFHTSLYDQDEENPSHDASADDVCLGIEASGSASDAMDEDEDEDEDIIPLSVIVPAPLRRSFGIFCTGKGRGAFSGSVPRHRPRHKEPQFSMSPRNDALNR
ncbi:hypothetical protein EW145_g1610 [Phellinidium pouzarii]|uniref:Uncharacterized protein n=1 Tax=Phellinidium pouzarii TaxID=167371 RepID=A0A4S4LDY5_9AGAM|nr:hypothetical protein EW145_g1610 [Phellinidium pouzarii]